MTDEEPAGPSKDTRHAGADRASGAPSLVFDSAKLAPMRRLLMHLAPVAIAVLVGCLIRGYYPHAEALGTVLEFLALTGVTLVSGWWYGVALVNVAALALSWRGLPWLWTSSQLPSLWFLRVAILFVNRWLAHIDALLAWVTLAVVWGERIELQLPLVAAVVSLGPLVIDELAKQTTQVRGWEVTPATTAPESPQSPATGGEIHRETLHWRRRPFYYLATTIGLVGLLALAGRQLTHLGPIVVVLLASTLLRARYWQSRNARMNDGLDEGERRRAYIWSPLIDRGVVILAFLAALAVPLSKLSPEAEAGAGDRRARQASWTDCTPDPRPDGGGPPPVSLFVVADSQFHELTGSRTGVHLNLVDSVVPVAVRPVELDLLSGVTLAHFARTYRTLSTKRAGMKWAHMGDFADLGCGNELDRFGATFAGRFGGDLAALVPGNHDSTFFGNFSWHPDWLGNCPSGLLTKTASDGKLRQMAETLVAGAPKGPAFSDKAAHYLASVTELGTVSEQRVLGIFIDTSDHSDNVFVDVGVAGLFGQVSQKQLNWIESKIDPDAWLVVFMHHPYGSLFDKPVVERFLLAHQQRVLALVTAHTHLAAHRHMLPPLSNIQELVVGSTTDPPQEASILEVEAGADGRPSLRLSTVPAVARKGQTCVDTLGVKAIECTDMIERLKDRKQCRELLGACDSRTTEMAGGCPKLRDPRCPELIDNCSPSLEQCSASPSTPREVKCLQQGRAWRLLKCVLADGAKLPPPAELLELPAGGALDAEPTHWIDGLLTDPSIADVGSVSNATPDQPLSERDLVCLSWAASVLQGHKREGWGLRQALDFAFEPSATFGAKEMICGAPPAPSLKPSVSASATATVPTSGSAAPITVASATPRARPEK